MGDGVSQKGFDFGGCVAAAAGMLGGEHDKGAVAGPLVAADHARQAVVEDAGEFGVAVTVFANAVEEQEQRAALAVAITGREIFVITLPSVGGAERLGR